MKKKTHEIKHKINVRRGAENPTPCTCTILIDKTLLDDTVKLQSNPNSEFSDRLQDFWDRRAEREELKKLENKLWWDDFKFELRYWGTVLIAAILLGLAISKK